MLKLLMAILLDEGGGTLSITRCTANTLITAAGFNGRFDEIEAEVNSLDTANYADDSVTAAKLASDVIRAGYGLVQHTDGSLYVDVSDTNPCLEISDGGVRAKTDETTIERASGGLQVKQAGLDHGTIGGLTDDDHSQYLNTARHDADDHSSFSYASMGTGVLPTTKGGTGLTTGFIKVGTYSGTGVAKSITGIGFQPDIVMVFQQDGSYGTRLRTSGDSASKHIDATSYTSNMITSLDSDGFSVGTSTDVNASGSTYTYIAIKSI